MRKRWHCTVRVQLFVSPTQGLGVAMWLCSAWMAPPVPMRNVQALLVHMELGSTACLGPNNVFMSCMRR